MTTPVETLALTKLKESGLDKKDMKFLKMKPLPAEQLEAMGHRHGCGRGGLVIPYFALNGEPTQFHRVRFLGEPPINGFKFKPEGLDRYGQLAGTINQVYLPPSLPEPWAAIAVDVSKPIVLTEGEFKAAAMCKAGIPTMGLGGVWCFRAAKHGLARLPIFNDIQCDGRTIIIGFDSDAATNSKIVSAELAVIRMLVDKGAKPVVLRIPSEDGKKVGLDDYLVAHGVDKMWELLKTAAPVPELELHEMNDKFVYVKEISSVVDTRTMQTRAVYPFINYDYKNKFYTVRVSTPKGTADKQVNIAQAWMEWPRRNEAESLCFKPGQGLMVDGCLNVWQGWPFEPRPGNIEPFKQLLAHLFVREPEHMKWFLQWLAYPIQHPGTKLHACAVLWGQAKGAGKGLLGEAMCRLYGAHGKLIGEQQLESNFNAWQEQTSFATADEITGRDSLRFADKLKSIITRRSAFIERKGVDSYERADIVNYLLFSNHSNAFRLEKGDRRYFIIETPAEKLSDEFYDEVGTWKNSDEGIQALMYFLLHVDLTGFSPTHAPPVTQAAKNMLEVSRSGHATWVARLETDSEVLLPKWELATPEEMLQLYNIDAEKRSRVAPTVGASGMAVALIAEGFQHACRGQGVRLSNGTQPKIFVITQDAQRRLALLQAPASVIKTLYEAERKEAKKKGAKLR